MTDESNLNDSNNMSINEDETELLIEVGFALISVFQVPSHTPINDVTFSLFYRMNT